MKTGHDVNLHSDGMGFPGKYVLSPGIAWTPAHDIIDYIYTF